MKTMLWVVVVAAVLMMGLKAEGKDLAVIDQWGGVVKDNGVKQALPGSGVVGDLDAWDLVWKATHPEDAEGISPPAVDFETDMVLIGTVPGPNKVSRVEKLTLDEKGNVDVKVGGTEMAGPGFGFVFLRVGREGIKSVNGKVLTYPLKAKKEKVGVRSDAEMQLAGTAVRAITDTGEFGSIWRADVGEAEKKWEVDFSKELVVMVHASRSSVKVEEVTVDANGDVKVGVQKTALPGGRGVVVGYGWALLVIDREGVVSVDGKVLVPVVPTTVPGAGK